MLYPISIVIFMNNSTLYKLGVAGVSAGLLNLAIMAQAAEPYQAISTLTQQCGLPLDAQLDAAAKPYVEGLVAVEGPKPTWLTSVCPEASAAKSEERLDRVKAVLGAHLLHQANTHSSLSAAQRKSIGQAIGRPKVGLLKKDRILAWVFNELRANAAYAGKNTDGLAYQIKDTAPAVSKTLNDFAERFGP